MKNNFKLLLILLLVSAAFTYQYQQPVLFAGSITDEQIKDKDAPVTKDDTSVDEIKSIDSNKKKDKKRFKRKRNLRKIKLKRTKQ